jgi:dTDP-glucose 4,6-dehydratase
MKMGPPDYVVNFASESHVDRSIEDPVPFIKNNVDIALNMVEYCRIVHPDKFIQISTDEVYGAAPDGVFFKEWSEILPSNPYAASKAAQEAICIGHWRAYGVPLILINCMNLVGEYQDNEKYLPLVIGKLHRGDTLTIHGNKDYIGKRTYIHARNLADGILFLLNEIHPVKFEQSLTSVIKPSRFNICGEKELNNLEVAQAVAEIMGKPLKYELVDFHLTRPGHDMRYGLDGSKIHQAGWKQPFTLEESLGKMIKWYLDNPEWL